MLGHGVGFCSDHGGLVMVWRMRWLRWFVGRGSMVLFCVGRRCRYDLGSSLCCEDGFVVLVKVKLLQEFPGFGRSPEPPISGPADKHQSCRSSTLPLPVTTYCIEARKYHRPWLCNFRSHAASMINAFLVFNNTGQPRLTRFYTQIVSLNAIRITTTTAAPS